MGKPFDLKAALAGAPVQTKLGRRVLRLVHMPDAAVWERVIALLAASPENELSFCSESGRSSLYPDFDLEMATTKRTVYVNIMKVPSTRQVLASHVFDTEAKAYEYVATLNRYSKISMVATAVPIEIEE